MFSLGFHLHEGKQTKSTDIISALVKLPVLPWPAWPLTGRARIHHMRFPSYSLQLFLSYKHKSQNRANTGTSHPQLLKPTITPYLWLSDVTVVEPYTKFLSLAPTLQFLERQRSSPTTLELWFILDDAPELALSIPVVKCRTLSVHPLRWLRFLGYSIYGREGYLSLSATGPPLDDDTADTAACSYYFISKGKLQCH